MTQISVVILTLNEERNIGRCLESVKDIADDIVVIDSYSTDRTEEICLSYGARFIQHPFEGHIEQKNFGITQAKFPHILSLDGDEALSGTLKKSIIEVKENFKFDGYYFNRITNYCGRWIRHGSWYPARKLRLWDSLKGRWGSMNPHDKFILKKGATQKWLKGDLLHYSYYSIGQHLEQINKFTDILAKGYYVGGRSASYFTILVHASWRFFRDYIIKLGFLDGFFGLVICMNSFYETFIKYVKLRRIMEEEKHTQRTTICFFNSTQAWGGGEKWHFDISTRLHALQYQVMVITNKSSELHHRVAQTNLKLFDILVSNFSFLNPFKVLTIARLFRRNHVKTVIINLSGDLKVAGLAARLAKVENIVYRRGSAIPIRNSFFNRYLFSSVVTHIIANSEETKRTIMVNNPNLFDPRKITVIYNGINLKKFDEQIFTPIYQRIGREIIIGNAGRLVKQKGQKFLIELAKQLKDKGYDFKILIAGDGKLKADLEQKAREFNVEKELVFLGFVEDIKSFMMSIDIFCLTSLWEGFGYVLVEAMACEKPIVAFNVSSNPEIINEGDTGYLVPSNDMPALVEKTAALIKDTALCETFGRKGRTRAEQVFDIEKTTRLVEKLLCCLSAGKNT